MSCFLFKTRWNRSTLVFFVKIFLTLSLWFSFGGEVVANPTTVESKNPSVTSASKKNTEASQTKKTNTKLSSKPVSKNRNEKTDSNQLSNFKRNYKNHKGNWKPMELTWEESSGAVAPEFRYAKKFHLFTDVKKIFLSRKIIKNGKLVLEETKEIPDKLYQKWMNDLFKKGIHQLPYEEIPKEQITGISYNFVNFRYSSTKLKFYYKLEEINQPEWVHKKAIIESIERMKP